MLIEIKHRYTGDVLCVVEAERLRGADLRGADLRGANLHGADLSDTDMHGADLRGANLFGADLSDADLFDANLRGADLRGADLCDANLCDADLHGADLHGADLRGAIGNAREVRSLQCDTWPVTWTEHAVQIGYYRHTWAEWLAFDDETIAAIDGQALAWWRRWKPVLVRAMEIAPATPNGHVEGGTDD